MWKQKDRKALVQGLLPTQHPDPVASLGPFVSLLSQGKNCILPTLARHMTLSSNKCDHILKRIFCFKIIITIQWLNLIRPFNLPRGLDTEANRQSRVQVTKEEFLGGRIINCGLLIYWKTVFFKGPQPLEYFIPSVTHSKRRGKAECF